MNNLTTNKPCRRTHYAPWHVKFQSLVINGPQDKEWQPFGRQTDRQTDKRTDVHLKYITLSSRCLHQENHILLIQLAVVKTN